MLFRSDGKAVKLQIWDTAGQDRFRTITQTYYKGAMGVILAYDCTDENSFNNIKNWMKQLEAHAIPGVSKVLIGNKCDSVNKKIDATKGKALADEYKMGFFETSAKNNINVKETFYHLAREIKLKILPNGNPTANGLKLTGNQKDGQDGKKASNCC